jgi:hypothetical protein
MTTKERLIKAIAPLGKTDEERAARIGVTARTIGYWKNDKGLKNLARLEAAGVIRIIDPSDQIAA